MSFKITADESNVDSLLDFALKFKHLASGVGKEIETFSAASFSNLKVTVLDQEPIHSLCIEVNGFDINLNFDPDEDAFTNTGEELLSPLDTSHMQILTVLNDLHEYVKLVPIAKLNCGDVILYLGKACAVLDTTYDFDSVLEFLLHLEETVFYESNVSAHNIVDHLVKNTTLLQSLLLAKNSKEFVDNLFHVMEASSEHVLSRNEYDIHSHLVVEVYEKYLSDICRNMYIVSSSVDPLSVRQDSLCVRVHENLIPSKIKLATDLD